MNDCDEDFKGKTIPKKYWNKLVEWKVHGPYDGCFYKYSQACVDMNGNFISINSEGRDLNDWMEFHQSKHGLVMGYKGLYDHSDGWSERMKNAIRLKHGFLSVEGAESEFSRILYSAIEKVFGKKWYEVPYETRQRSTEVEKLVAKDRERLEAYRKDMADYERRRQERLNAIFMGALMDCELDEWKLYPLTPNNIKHTCERFCRDYDCTVGVMCGVLDRLAEIGYDVWCKCSDCGEMFQLSNYEKFSHLIDDNASRGDGGIGVIFTRVQCESCRELTECPECHEPNLPTQQQHKDGHAYDYYSFRERFLAQWLGVCDYCADAFFRKDEYKHWDEELDELESKIDKGKAELDRYIATMKEQGKSEEELNELAGKNLVHLKSDWADLVNELRDKMQDDVDAHFDANDWSGNHVTADDKSYIWS